MNAEFSPESESLLKYLDASFASFWADKTEGLVFTDLRISLLPLELTGKEPGFKSLCTLLQLAQLSVPLFVSYWGVLHSALFREKRSLFKRVRLRHIHLTDWRSATCPYG